MARMKPEQAAEIVAAYNEDSDWTVRGLAEELGLAQPSVRKALLDAGVTLRAGDAAGASAPALADLTGSAAFKDAVAQAVAEAMAKAGPVVPSGVDPMAFLAEMRELTKAFQVQSPGYNKPVAPEEIARREAGEIEFKRLIAEAADAVEEYGRQGARDRGLLPEYLVGPKGLFTETDQGEQLFSPGQRIFYTRPPTADFEPLNIVAGHIMVSQMQWIGQKCDDAEEMVRKAQVRLAGGDPSLEDRQRDSRNKEFVQVVPDSQVATMGPRRIMGTTVEEEGNDGHTRFKVTKGHVARPVSRPVFA